MTREQELRDEILKLTREYYEVAFPEKPFVGGISQVPVSGKVFDARRDEQPRRRVARLLVDDRPLRRGVREALREGHGRAARDAVQLGLVGEPPRGLRAHVAPPRQAASASRATK